MANNLLRPRELRKTDYMCCSRQRRIHPPVPIVPIDELCFAQRGNCRKDIKKRSSFHVTIINISRNEARRMRAATESKSQLIHKTN